MRPAPCCPKRPTPDFESYAVTLRGQRLSDWLGGAVIDALLENRRRLEHHNASRRNRHFFAGFRVSANTLALLTHDKRAKRGELHGFAALKAVGDLLEHQLHQSRGFRA